MAYNNRFQQQAPSNNLNPSRFAQNPTRAKSTRWTAAKAHNYDGDDWGDEYEDEYNGDIYSSPYQAQQSSYGGQYGSAYGGGAHGGQSQYGGQDFSLSRSSTQPVVQGSYPAYETQEDTPGPLLRQGTTPVASASQRYTSSGIQRKPSKMDKDREAPKPSQHENEYVEPAVSSVSAPVQGIQSPNPVVYSPEAASSTPPPIIVDNTITKSAVTNGGYTTPTKQPGSPTGPSSGSPTLRRPADIYAAAIQKTSEALAFRVDAGGNDDIPETANTEKQTEQPPQQSILAVAKTPRAETSPAEISQVETSQTGASQAETFQAGASQAGTSQPIEEPPAQIHREITPVPEFEVIIPEPSTSLEAKLPPGSVYPAPPRIEEQPPSPLSEHPGNDDIYSAPLRNSNLFLDTNTDDDINRNIKLVTPPPSQPGHFLTIPEPVQELPRGYESDSDEEGGLFHTSTPPRRGSLSPTGGGDFSFDGVGYPVVPDSPADAHPIEHESNMQNAAVVALSESKAEPRSVNEAQPPVQVSRTPPTEAATPQPQPQSVIEKVSDVTSSVANTFSSFVASALHRDQGPETNPIIRTDSPALQSRDQTTSPSLAISPRPETPAEAAVQTHSTAIGDVQSSLATQPDNGPPQEAENPIRSRETTPNRFEEDEDEEVIIEEARRGAWGMATHVAISQSQSPSPSQSQSPTKSPTQSPLAAELSQPLITKVTQPVIHTPQPTSSQIEQSVIIQEPPSERAISPASHVSSTHSKTPSSFTAAASPVQSSERRSPQPTSFAEFLKRSPQSTPSGIASSPPVASESPALVAPAVVSAPVSFKAFMTSRGNPTAEPERSTPPISTPPISTPPAPSFKDFLSQKTPASQPITYHTHEAPAAVEPQETPRNHTPVGQHSPIRHSLIETRAIPPIEPPVNVAREAPPSEPSSTVSHLDEGEALRRAILKGLDAESQPETPDTPNNDYMRNVDTQFESSHSVSVPDSPVIERTASYKGKMPQRTASLAVSDVSEEHYRPQPFETSQYQRFPKQGTAKTYPAPPASDISAPSKSGEDPVFTPPTRSVVGEQNQEYEPSIQEEPEYQPSIVSEQYVPSPVDTVHPVKPFQMQRDFNEIPTLLNLSDILALSDSKDRIAASEKARKIHAQQSQQGANDLQVWLHHVQEINNQNAQLWTYNSTRPGMHDLRSNPLVSGRFDLFVQQNHVEHSKWGAWGRLDDGVLGSRPSTAASNDPMAPKKPKAAPTNAAASHTGQRLPSQNQDNRAPGAPSQNGPTINLPSQSGAASQPQTQGFQPGTVKGEPAPSIATTEPSKDDHPEGKKKSGLKGRLKNILGRKKDKTESQPPVAVEPTPQIILPQQVQQQPLPQQQPHPQQQPSPQQQHHRQAAIPAHPPQNEKYPQTIGQQGAAPGQPQSSPQGAPHFSANGVATPHDHQHPQNKLVISKQDEYLPPLSFQKGNKSPSLGEAINLPSSNSVPDLRARSQNQQQKEDPAKGSQNNLQGLAGPNQVPKQGDQQPPAGPATRRPSTSGAAPGPPPPRAFDDDGPPPLRRISNSKPPPPRKRISSIPASVPEGSYPPGAFNASHAHPHEPQDPSLRPGTGEGHLQHGGQPNLRVESSGGYEPSVSSASSDQAKKSRLSVFNKFKATPGTPHSPSTVHGPSDTGSPRHSVHTISSQPSGTTEKRNSSFFQNQLKRFDQLVVGKDRANEFHQQQAHGPAPNGQAAAQAGPEPGINRQQSFPVDGSSSVHTAAEPKKKNRFAALINDIKTTDPHAHEEKKVRKGSFFSKSHTESSPVVANQSTPISGQPGAQQSYPQPNGQIPVFNPGQNVVVPIPGQYPSFSQGSQIQSGAPYGNGAGDAPNQHQPILQHPHAQPAGQINAGIPPPPVVPVQNVTVTRKPSNPPPPTARFLAVPPSPPPIRSAAPVEEESIYAPPVNHKASPVQNQKTDDDSPPPMRPHQTSSPSPPPRIVYAPPAAPVMQAEPVQFEPRSVVVEPPPTLQTSKIPEQESKVMSPTSSKGKEPESTSFPAHPTSFVVGEIISTPPPVQATSPPPQEIQKAEPPKEEPPRVEITPATAVESEAPKLAPLVISSAEATSSKPGSPQPEEQKAKIEEPNPAKEEVTPQAESSTKATSPEPLKASNEDYDKIAVDPEGPVPEEEERIVMSATTQPGFGDWEYF
ncbi:hypothetical protein TWF730_001311 [Orbilia blumenaviensis]|uniref:Uncharacterized protein n=1 Tax=Orbilia blumenaviensis TaxID=1796055 RepID=A0AAV9UIB1_9PEZI